MSASGGRLNYRSFRMVPLSFNLFMARVMLRGEMSAPLNNMVFCAPKECVRN